MWTMLTGGQNDRVAILQPTAHPSMYFRFPGLDGYPGWDI